MHMCYVRDEPSRLQSLHAAYVCRATLKRPRHHQCVRMINGYKMSLPSFMMSAALKRRKKVNRHRVLVTHCTTPVGYAKCEDPQAQQLSSGDSPISYAAD